MKHLGEEELIEQYYSKGEGAAATRQHLKACAECAEAYAALGSDLAEMEFAEPPARDASYGERVWESLSRSLPAYEARKRSWLRGGPVGAGPPAILCCRPAGPCGTRTAFGVVPGSRRV